MTQAKFPPYDPNNRKDKIQVLEIRNEVGGFKSYGMPDYVAAANWMKVSADIALLHKSAIENGIQPSVIYRYPYLMKPEERAIWEDGQRRHAKGARNYGRAMKIEAPGRDLMPEVDVVQTTDNHALFEQTSKEQKEEIAIAHGLNPALMGVRIAGSLGQNEEIEFSARQFKQMWVSENRDHVEGFFNEIIGIFNVPFKFNIIEAELVELQQAKTEEI
jgi:hypothetical protein